METFDFETAIEKANINKFLKYTRKTGVEQVLYMLKRKQILEEWADWTDYCSRTASG